MPAVLTSERGSALLNPPTRPAGGERRVSLLTLCGLALMIGVMTGFGAVAFRALIALVHNVFYSGRLSFVFDANLSEGPSRFGDLVLFSPIIGGLIVVFLVKHFAPEAKGHGVPEVMDAVFYKHGNIRGKVALVKALASALSIGSGAAVGREGPIIQIGSALGSAFAQFIGLSTWQKITLLSAGAGAGIAATFNTPLGGVLFALEILLPEVSNRTFLPVVVATGAATTIGRILIGPDPAFAVPDVEFSLAGSLAPVEILGFLLLGLLCGVAAWAFIRLLVLMEDGFPKLPGNEYTQNVIGMTAIGGMMVVLTHLFGHSYVDGVGYSVIQSILDQKMTAAGLLALLFVLKMLATSISLGCGASGGIFSPSLYIGATLGAAFAAAMGMVLPHTGLSLPSAAIIGMAAMVGAATGGVMTAIVMVFEMTRDYAIIVPVIVAVALAAGVRRALIPRDDLYDQAAPSRPSHPQGAAHQPLSGQAGPGHHGARVHRRHGRHAIERCDDGGRCRRRPRHRGRAGGTHRRTDSAALGPVAGSAHQSGHTGRAIHRAPPRHLPRSGSFEPGARAIEAPPRRRRGGGSLCSAPTHQRCGRDHYQARRRRRGDRQLRGLIAGATLLHLRPSV